MKRAVPFVVLDTETSGLDPLKHSLLSVGLVDWTGDRSLEFLVKEPEIVSDPESMKVNHIDLEKVQAQGLTPVQACERLAQYIDELSQAAGESVMVVGHNVAFDIAFLRRIHHIAGYPFSSVFSHRTVDTHSLLWALVQSGKLPSQVTSSDAAFAHFGLMPPIELRHTALGDAWATRSLLLKLLELV